MTTEAKPQRLVAFAGPDNCGVNKRVAEIIAEWESLPPEFSVPLSFSAFQTITQTVQDGIAAIAIDGRNALEELQIAQGLLQSVLLKAMAKDDPEAAKAYDILRSGTFADIRPTT